MRIPIEQFAADPLAFFAALTIPSAHGPARFSDVWADYQVEWFRAIAPSLLAVARGEQPPIGRFWVERTKGGSKDSDCALCLLWLLAFSPRKLEMQIGAADKEQAGEMKKAAHDVLRLNPWLASRIESQLWTLLCRATGSECSIVASDVAGSHGARPDIVVMNELSHVTKEEFAQNLLDNASKKAHGLVIVATNSGFKGTWQERWRTIARDSERWHVHTFSQPAPWISPAELAEAERRNSRSRFRRLFWGEWVSQSGDALDEVDIQAAINPNLQPGLLRQGDFYVAGLDLGIKHDHSALVVLAGSHQSLQLRLVEATSWAPDPSTGKVSLMRIEDAVLAAHGRYGLRVVGFDPYQAELMAQRLTARRVPMEQMQFSGSNLNRMASTLLEVFRSRRLELYNHPRLIDDLGRLNIEERSYGFRLSATRDESGHADLATALAIALPLAVDVASKPIRIVGTPMF
jgi:phage terminase large subunit-like protein